MASLENETITKGRSGLMGSNDNANNLPAVVESSPQANQEKSAVNAESVLTNSEIRPGFNQNQFSNCGANTNFNNLKANSHLSSIPYMKIWEEYNEEQLEQLLIKRLQLVYNEAYLSLMSYGYQSNVAIRAILTNGHCFGNTDALGNIIHNSLTYIKSGMVFDNATYPEQQKAIVEAGMLVRRSLEAMIYFLFDVRPGLIKWDAMRCLLVSNFHLGIASNINGPFRHNQCSKDGSQTNNSTDASSGVCEVQEKRDCSASDWNKHYPFAQNSDGILERYLKLPKKFNLSPALASELNRNVVDYAAAYRANINVSPRQPKALSSPWPQKKLSALYAWEDSCVVNLLLGGVDGVSVKSEPEVDLSDPKVQLISSLVNQIKEVKEQLKDRKEWAHEKVMQAAKKLSNDLIELKMLRLEREEKHRAKSSGLQTEEEAMKLLEMENAIRKANCKVDIANAGVKKLEIQNAEIKAEVEAFKLSASESDKMSAEVAKKERKCLKRIMTLEKQHNKLKEELQDKKKKSLELQQELVSIQKAQKKIEWMWRQEVQAKELATIQIQEELKLKEEADVNAKGKMEAAHQKIVMDCQLHKDDMERLMEEVSRLQISSDLTNPYHQQNVMFSGQLELQRPQIDTFNMVHTNQNLSAHLFEEEICNHLCLICTNNQASVLFLPCAHQILCPHCTLLFNHTEARCPCCQAPIIQRIHVYGVSS
ncbi:hypothetical protein SLE2022_072850 [Rubroshorea leprosula]